jgi:glycosyltransferase involved in cell wall biosynthesis
MSAHGVRELKTAGLNFLYAPLGIDTKIFKPNADGRKAFRSELGLTDENFVIGSVGLNYRDDRKGFIPLMIAFKEFHAQHPEARLYIHSLANERNMMADCINYHEFAARLGIDKWLIWPNQREYYLGRIGEDQLCEIYNGFDVFCLATKGEGFGIPIIEAQACGIPAITTETTTGPELFGPGWLIPVDKMDDTNFLLHQTWRLEPRPSSILYKLEDAFASWKNSKAPSNEQDEWFKDWSKLKENSIANASQYDWNIIWPKYWEPILKTMESKLENWP